MSLPGAQIEFEGTKEAKDTSNLVLAIIDLRALPGTLAAVKPWP